MMITTLTGAASSEASSEQDASPMAATSQPALMTVGYDGMIRIWVEVTLAPSLGTNPPVSPPRYLDSMLVMCILFVLAAWHPRRFCSTVGHCQGSKGSSNKTPRATHHVEVSYKCFHFHPALAFSFLQSGLLCAHL